MLKNFDLTEQFSRAGFTPTEAEEFSRAYRFNERAITHWGNNFQWDRERMLRHVRHVVVHVHEPAQGCFGATYTGD